ncbi:MAG TPA: hypothetical protein PLC65_05940 [Bacteroidia bacterium]|nr:hypothetical protein [Bacteroidia bacterium]
MKLTTKIVSIALLLFNGIGAIYGGGSLILHPDGSGLQMPLDILKSSPFSDFLIPGIVLFIVNGLGSFFALFTILFNQKKNYLFVIAEGVVLCGWIVIQIIMIKQLLTLHYVMFTTGVMLIVIGYLIKRLNK